MSGRRFSGCSVVEKCGTVVSLELKEIAKLPVQVPLLHPQGVVKDHFLLTSAARLSRCCSCFFVIVFFSPQKNKTVSGVQRRTKSPLDLLCGAPCRGVTMAPPHPLCAAPTRRCGRLHLPCWRPPRRGEKSHCLPPGPRGPHGPPAFCVGAEEQRAPYIC